MLRALTIALLALVVLWPSTVSAYYNRSQAEVERAIHIVAPQVNKVSRASYARAIRSAARKHRIDPFTLVSIFWHESGFRARAVGGGEDYGLGQIRARYFSGCDSTIPASQDSSPSCLAVKANLLNPTYNINKTASTIAATRKACRRMTNRSALFHRWLAAYGGTKGTCGQAKRRGRWRDLPRHKGVREIIRCRKSLIRHRQCKRIRTSASASRSARRRSSTRSKRAR